MFALLPYSFWQIITTEVNRYANQHTEKKTKKKKIIAGTKWTAVTVTDMMTFLGLLLLYILFPCTGRRMRDFWEDVDRNPWTVNMSRSWFLQILAMLHFNDYEVDVGASTDAVHKI
jgi:hypothetical protein